METEKPYHQLMEGKSDEEILVLAEPLLAELRENSEIPDDDLIITIGADSYTSGQMYEEIKSLTDVGKKYLSGYLYALYDMHIFAGRGEEIKSS